MDPQYYRRPMTAPYGGPENIMRPPNEPMRAPGDHGFAGDEDKSLSRIKRKRASKACDACRVRKVKCDASSIPCPQCAEHEIPCLFTAPAKKRGPPNAYVEAHKAKQQSIDGMHTNQQHAPPPTAFLESRQAPTHTNHVRGQSTPETQYQTNRADFGQRTTQQQQQSQQLLHQPAVPLPSAPSLHHQQPPQALHHQRQTRPLQDRGLEELTTPEVLNRLFDDFFMYVYPICPIILESQFRRTLSHPPSYNDDFLALCGSLLGLTIACLRSNNANYGGLTIEDTYQFSMFRLGMNYRDRMSVQILATLEYHSMASAYSARKDVSDNPRAVFLFGEFITGLTFTIGESAFGQKDFLTQQLLKRMFQCIFISQATVLLSGGISLLDYSLMERWASKFPDRLIPMDLSDAELERMNAAGGSNEYGATQFSDLLVPSAKGYAAAFSLLSGLFRIYVCGYPQRLDETLPRVERYKMTCDALQKVRHCFDNVPLQLRWDENNKVHGVGFEVQKASLYVSRMQLSSVLLDQCYQLGSSSDDPEMNVQDLDRQKRLVVSETLKIIKTISRRALEANGESMISRIRSVASTLVDLTKSQNDTVASTAKRELSDFVEILKLLETGDSGPANGYSWNNNTNSAWEDGWRRFRKEQGLTML